MVSTACATILELTAVSVLAKTFQCLKVLSIATVTAPLALSVNAKPLSTSNKIDETLATKTLFDGSFTSPIEGKEVD